MSRRLMLPTALLFSFGGTTASAGDHPPSRAATCAQASEAAQTLRDNHKLLDAREQLRVCAEPTCPRPIKLDCDQLLGEVLAAIPTVVLAVRDVDGRDVPDARVSLDGVALSHALAGQPVEIEPGPHTFHAQIPGAQDLDTSFVARESEKERLVSLQVPAQTAQVLAQTAPATARRGVPWYVYVAGGATVTAAGIFGYLAVTGQSQYDACKIGACDVGSLEAKRALAWSTAGVTLLAAGATLWFALRHDSALPPVGALPRYSPLGAQF